MQYQRNYSPLNYIGGKYKLLLQLLILFPANINTFVDLFAGGLDVTLNKDFLNQLMILNCTLLGKELVNR
ncbi:MAG: hypothetical protein HDR88_10685 [Bacteroides sp.]|nr:hypothetical protein [Bacteroides sp.]